MRNDVFMQLVDEILCLFGFVLHFCHNYSPIPKINKDPYKLITPSQKDNAGDVEANPK